MRGCNDIFINFIPLDSFDIQSISFKQKALKLHKWLKMSHFYFKTLPIEDIIALVEMANSQYISGKKLG